MAHERVKRAEMEFLNSRVVDMKMTEKMHGDVLVMSLTGNLIGEPESSELRNRIYGLLEKGTRKVVLDLADLKVINSMGLGVLVASLTSIRNRGGDLCLARLSDKVEGVLTLTQLIRVIKTYDSVERAVRGFR